MKLLIEIKHDPSSNSTLESANRELVKQFIQDVFKNDIYWRDMDTDASQLVYFQRLHSQGELVSIIEIDEVVKN